MFLAAIYGGPLPVHEETEFESFVDVLRSFRVDVSTKTDGQVVKQQTFQYVVENTVRGNILARIVNKGPFVIGKLP